MEGKSGGGGRERKGRGKREGRWEELPVAFHGVGMFSSLRWAHISRTSDL